MLYRETLRYFVAGRGSQQFWCVGCFATELHVSKRPLLGVHVQRRNDPTPAVFILFMLFMMQLPMLLLEMYGSSYGSTSWTCRVQGSVLTGATQDWWRWLLGV